MSGPLDGLLVADFSRVLAGPLATMTLADLGATVIKVERPDTGDDTRAWGPPWSSWSAPEPVATYFDTVNRSKQSLTLDLSDRDDQRLARELACRADVLVENFRPGTLSRYGLGYEQIQPDNPGIVYASISGFGSGPGADLPGYDFVAQAVGGLMSITGESGGAPTKVGVALVDVLTGKDAVIGILAALQERSRSGQGCRLEVNLLSSLLAGLVNQAQGYLGAGRIPGPMGNQHPSIAPYETVRCRDGLLALACGNDGQFGRLAEYLGRPEWSADPRFRSNADRVAHREDLVAELEALMGGHDAAFWADRLNAAGVPAGRVNDVAGAVALADRLGLRPTLDLGPDAAPQIRHAVDYSRPLLGRSFRPPQLGEHSPLLRSWLAGDRDSPVPLCSAAVLDRSTADGDQSARSHDPSPSAPLTAGDPR